MNAINHQMVYASVSYRPSSALSVCKTMTAYAADIFHLSLH